VSRSDQSWSRRRCIHDPVGASVRATSPLRTQHPRRVTVYRPLSRRRVRRVRSTLEGVTVSRSHLAVVEWATGLHITQVCPGR